MKEYLKLQVKNCQNCYKCIRYCPVKSINFSDDKAQIIPQECVLCGQCYVTCPQHAKEILPEVWKVKDLMRGEGPLIASVAPSYIANYPGVNMTSFEKALRRLGFSAAQETALGATVVKRKYDEMARSGRQDVVISSCCHSVNLLIEKHFPQALPSLAKILSPMLAHGKMIKKEQPGSRVVFIGPCIAKKEEIDSHPGLVDAVLTFEELDAWMAGEGIVFEEMEDDREKGKARLFPVPGGILRTMECDSEDTTYLVIDGQDNCISALRDVVSGDLRNCFIEMSMCAGSCVGGPVMKESRRTPVRNYKEVDRFAGKNDFTTTPLTARELSKNVHPRKVRSQRPEEEDIRQILRSIGKTRPEHELNCGSCGYDSCRSKARAVFTGKADLTMCLPYLKGKAESLSDKVLMNTPNAIIVLGEDLVIQQMNEAARSLLRLSHVADAIGQPIDTLLPSKPYLDAMLGNEPSKETTRYLEGVDAYVQEYILYDAKYHIIIVLFRDITAEHNERLKKQEVSKHTLEVTEAVIEKQMRIVHEIASLLGETTAETKIALKSLQESLRNE